MNAHYKRIYKFFIINISKTKFSVLSFPVNGSTCKSYLIFFKLIFLGIAYALCSACNHHDCVLITIFEKTRQEQQFNFQNTQYYPDLCNLSGEKIKFWPLSVKEIIGQFWKQNQHMGAHWYCMLCSCECSVGMRLKIGTNVKGNLFGKCICVFL